MTLAVDALFDAIDGTWPPARVLKTDEWLIRVGEGGGKRVSAATALCPVTDKSISLAETTMRRLQQSPLFMVRGSDQSLDAALAARGYQIIDPVVALITPVDALVDVPVPPLTCFTIWEPLAVMEEIWARGGIGPARLSVMRRAGLKTGLFSRCDNTPAGCGFVAVSGQVAMVHAVEVLPELRRRGVAGWMMREAAFWARDQGAAYLSVLCTKANTAALGLYSSLGFEKVAEYHYRHNATDGDLTHG